MLPRQKNSCCNKLLFNYLPLKYGTTYVGMPNDGMPNVGMPNDGMPNLALMQEYQTTEYRMRNAEK
jgi:hypothetical protein